MEGVLILSVNNFGDTRSGGLAGPMGLFIIIVLAVATVLLIRNMNVRLRRLPSEFPPPEQTAAPTAAELAAADQAAAAERTAAAEKAAAEKAAAEKAAAADDDVAGEQASGGEPAPGSGPRG